MTKQAYVQPQIKTVEFVVELGQTLSSNASENHRGFEQMVENENDKLFGSRAFQ